MPVENKIQRFFRGIGIVVLFPLILLFGLLTMIPLGFLALIQKIKGSENVEVEESGWMTHVETPQVTLLKKYIGAVRFGPEYFELRGQPEIEELDGKVFGDWFFVWKNYLFIQQWNSVEDANADLVAINLETHEIETVHKNIPAVAWQMYDDSQGKLQLVCHTGKEQWHYSIMSSQ